MGASFYGNHMVHCTGMDPEEAKARREFRDNLKRADDELAAAKAEAAPRPNEDPHLSTA